MNQETDTLTGDGPPRETVGHLEAHVRSQLSGRIHDFGLMMREGGLVLKGLTRTYHAKQLAQHAIMEAARLPIQENEIEVIGTRAEQGALHHV